MEIIADYILANMLKTQLVDIYRTYSKNPAMLDESITAKMAYDWLKKSDTVKNFNWWLQQACKSDLSFTCMDGIEYQNNLLGEFADLASEANEATIAEFIRWKKEISPETIEQVEEQSAHDVSKVEKALTEKHDAHIVLFNNGGQWAALGVDAERLFELYGWQPGYVVNEDGCHVAFMYVNKYGIDVLENSKYFVKRLLLGNVNIISESFLEDETACAQQMLDYLRIVQTDIDKMTRFVKKSFPVVARHGMTPRLIQVLNLHISTADITTRLDTDSVFTVADGSSWRLDEKGLPICIALSKQWEKMDT